MKHLIREIKASFIQIWKRCCLLFVGLIILTSVNAYSPALSVNKETASKNRVLDVNQQKKKIKGKVVDEKGEAIIGASIVVNGSTTGTITDLDGNFSIEVSLGSILEISFMGYLPVSVSADKSDLKIMLKEDTKLLDEIVVVGYGTQRKGEITSAISGVSKESFAKGSVSDAAQLIRGKVAGLGVVKPSGDPTAKSQLFLRGAGTINSGTEPLVIIDGIPGDLSFVAPEDIENVDVVKDGSAAAIYGTRGNNGVIFITTKKGKAISKPEIEVQSYLTIQSISKRLDMMSADQYRQLVEEGRKGAIDYNTGSTNWLDEILRTPITSVTNVSFRGGTDQTNYVANVNYNDAQGIIKKSDNKVLTTRLELNQNMWDNKLRINLNMYGKQQNYTSLCSPNFPEVSDRPTLYKDIYKWALVDNPTDAPKDKDGNWIHRTANLSYNNPVAAIDELSSENKNTKYQFSGSAAFYPLEQWFIKVLTSRTIESETSGYFQSSKHSLSVRSGYYGYASKESFRNEENLLELTTQYKNRFEKHEVTALFGYAYQDDMLEFYSMKNWDFASNKTTHNNMGGGEALNRGEAEMSSQKILSKLVGGFARFNYNYNNKYLFSASVRREGSTKFGNNHKWGNFPAVSVGWNMKEEDFLKQVVPVSNFKLRVGYGITGTTPNESYMSKKLLASDQNFLEGDSWLQIIRPKNNANPELRWEKKHEWNFGVDYSLFDDFVTGSIDYYVRNTKDLIFEYLVPIPIYLHPKIYANGGDIQNKGLELNVNVNVVRTKDVSWNSMVNFSTNTNKLTSLSTDKFSTDRTFLDVGWTDEPIQQTTHRIELGKPLGNFYGYKTIDIDSDGKWIIEGKDGKPKPIGEQVVDDKKVIGNGIPRHFLSWDNTITYKNFDLNITMRGAFGYDVLNFPKMFLDVPSSLNRGNIMSTAFDKRYGKVPLSEDQEMQYVSYYIEKGDFWKIDNITLGYNWMLNNKYLKKARFYASVNNLATFTSYSGIDPEVEITGREPGRDLLTRYPSTRTFTVGAMFTF